MKTKTISVNRALREKKTLADRVKKAIYDGVFIDGVKNSATKIKGLTMDEYRNEMRADFSSVEDLMNYSIALNFAILKSNASTTVDFRGSRYTVSELIEKKKFLSEVELPFLTELQKQYSYAVKRVDNKNDSLESNFENFIVGLFGSKERATTEQIEANRKSFYETNGFSLINPLNLKDKISKMEAEILESLDEIDGALTDINATTMIEISW